MSTCPVNKVKAYVGNTGLVGDLGAIILVDPARKDTLNAITEAANAQHEAVEAAMAAEMAEMALKRFREGYLPSCGDGRGRRVHGVEPLHCEAERLWNQVPLPMRSEAIARHFIDSGAGDVSAAPSSAGRRKVSMSDLGSLIAAATEP